LFDKKKGKLFFTGFFRVQKKELCGGGGTSDKTSKLMPKALELLFALPTPPTPFVDFFF
jgi:hypothetical protein